MPETTERPKITNEDFVRTGPGTLAGRYMRMFWQPVARSKDIVAGRALPLRIMSEDLTVYRGETGAIHIVQGRCAHRATLLATGWVEGDTIRCRYHGWQYAPDGRCIEQPGEDAGFANKVCLRAYPAHEYLGLVFAYLGEGEPPPLRRYPDFERDGVVETGPVEVWPCNYFNRVDNVCDMAHVTFTHQESFRRAGMPWMRGNNDVTFTESAYGILTEKKLPDRPTAFFHFHMPNTNQTRSYGRVEGTREDAQKLWVDRLFWRVPIDDDNCISFVVDYLALTGDAADAYRERRRESESVGLETLNDTGAAIVQGKRRVEDSDERLSMYKMFWIEDYAVQVGQRPISERREEQLGKIDQGVILTRKLWRRELQALADGRPLTQWRTPAGLAEMSDRLVGAGN